MGCLSTLAMWGKMCRYLVMCREGEAMLIGEMLANPRSACLTLLLSSESVCVGNGPQM